jgi:hypothetical protein
MNIKEVLVKDVRLSAFRRFSPSTLPVHIAPNIRLLLSDPFNGVEL